LRDLLSDTVNTRPSRLIFIIVPVSGIISPWPSTHDSILKWAASHSNRFGISSTILGPGVHLLLPPHRRCTHLLIQQLPPWKVRRISSNGPRTFPCRTATLDSHQRHWLRDLLFLAVRILLHQRSRLLRIYSVDETTHLSFQLPDHPTAMHRPPQLATPWLGMVINKTPPDACLIRQYTSYRPSL
jgi:hypothetical protein